VQRDATAKADLDAGQPDRAAGHSS
jgi:hypothetical protein